MENNQKPEWSVDGMIFKPRRESAPDFVRGYLSVKVEEFKSFLDKNVKESGWVNLDLLKSKTGKTYLKLNTWEPKQVKETQSERSQDWNGPVVDDYNKITDIPF